VLRGVSFEVAAGEMVAVMGASGAGKSTLLHLLGGLEAADAGSIKLGDVEITGARRASLSRIRNEQVGFVFQFHHLLPDLTAMENVALPLLINRAKRQESKARAIAMLRGVGLGERLDYKVGLLSGGEQQRVALARALVRGPRLVLADEPTGNLDAATGEEITARLASFCKAQRAAVVVATHNERVANFCDRTLVLRDGKLV
jgi:lipoprotein-releasing system ATP-binding protein